MDSYATVIPYSLFPPSLISNNLSATLNILRKSVKISQFRYKAVAIAKLCNCNANIDPTEIMKNGVALYLPCSFPQKTMWLTTSFLMRLSGLVIYVKEHQHFIKTTI